MRCTVALAILACWAASGTAVPQSICSGFNNGPTLIANSQSSCSGNFFDVSQTWSVDCVKIPCGGCNISTYAILNVNVSAPTGGCLSETPTMNCGPIFYAPQLIQSQNGTHRLRVEYQKKKITIWPVPYTEFCQNDGPRMAEEAGCAHQYNCPGGCCEGPGSGAEECGATFEEKFACTELGGVWDDETCSCGGGTPILVSVRGNRLELTSPQEGVNFDLNGDGIQERLCWTAPGADDAFLVLDKNGNGVIDNGSELFGNVAPQEASADPNGFLALAWYDQASNGGNADGQIDSQDSIFFDLKFWIDSNHDGVSQDNELTAVSDSRTAGFDLNYRLSPRTDRYGNQFKYVSWVYMDPDRPGPRRKLAVDVVFAH